MAKEKVSSMTKWTEIEKFKVLFSILDNSGPTKWTEVYIPPGRSVKAVKSMLDTTRKQTELPEGDGTDATPVTGTKKTRAVTKPKLKASTKGVTKASARVKRKRGACGPEDIKAEEDGEEDDQNNDGLKRVKSEMEGSGAVKEDLEHSENNLDEENGEASMISV